MSAIAVHGYAATGALAELLSERRCVALPPPGTRRRGARLPLLACALAEKALDGALLPDCTAVLFATALGCLTESELFVTHMIDADEATPKPRAFSASVHNAIASRLALELGAHGECQTFVHGALSLFQAVFAAGCLRQREPETPILLGALDERPPGSFDPLAAAAGTPGDGEGGALFRCGGPGRCLALLEEIPADSTDCRMPIPSDAALHPSLVATRTALAIAVIAGEIDPRVTGFEQRPNRIAIPGAETMLLVRSPT